MAKSLITQWWPFLSLLCCNMFVLCIKHTNAVKVFFFVCSITPSKQFLAQLFFKDKEKATCYGKYCNQTVVSYGYCLKIFPRASQKCAFSKGDYLCTTSLSPKFCKDSYWRHHRGQAHACWPVNFKLSAKAKSFIPQKYMGADWDRIAEVYCSTIIGKALLPHKIKILSIPMVRKSKPQVTKN